MLIANVNKINKSFLPNITFILNVFSDEVLSENGIISV